MKYQMDLKDIKMLPKNNYNVVSLFSGAGGNSLGYLLSNYTIKLAVEFDKEAKETYEKNFPTTPVLYKDVREIDGKEILDLIGLKKYELDVLDGSPPCKSFSIAGVREKKWGEIGEYSGTQQRTDDLFFEYLRLVEDMMPKVFIAENVKGLTQGNAIKYLNAILKKADSIGYNIDYMVMDSSLYNVPQKRERVIFIGVRKDLELKPTYPKPSEKIITTKEAIGELIDEGTEVRPLTEYHLKYLNLCGFEASTADVKRFIAESGHKLYLTDFRRDYWDKPCYTMVASKRLVHPLRNRRLSILEGKRLQSFPDDFEFFHSPSQNWERIGRSAPPNLMAAVSKEVENEILNKAKNKSVAEIEEYLSTVTYEFDPIKIIGETKNE